MSERIQNNSAKLVKIKHIIFNKNRMGIGTVTFFCTWASAGRRHTTNRYKKVVMHNLNVLEVFSVYWFISTFGRKNTHSHTASKSFRLSEPSKLHRRCVCVYVWSGSTLVGFSNFIIFIVICMQSTPFFGGKIRHKHRFLNKIRSRREIIKQFNSI